LSNSQVEIVEETLAGVHTSGQYVLDAISWHEDGEQKFRAYFSGRGPTSEIEFTNNANGLTINNVQSVLGSLMVEGTVLPSIKTLLFKTKQGIIDLNTGAPDHTLFEGLNTGVLVRTDEAPRAIADWAAHHTAHHQLEAILVLNRQSKAGGGAEFMSRLRKQLTKVKRLKLVVVCHTDMPMGALYGLDGEHPFNAPDAPGKDRMKLPKPDPYRAPLAEGLAYEILKWRYLRDAAAVINLDICDYLATPRNNISVFEKAKTSDVGMVTLQGRRIYPWRVRNGDFPKLFDHISAQLDTKGTNRKWCIVPSRLPTKAIWRFVRVGGINPPKSDSAGFYRAMAIRHPAAKVSELVAKTNLIEDEALIEEFARISNHKPVRAPKSEIRDTYEVDENRTLIVTTMKNEGPFILEWIAHHQAIGVTDFLVYTNDCTDGTDTLLDVLQQKGIVQHRDNPFKKTKLKPQHAALQAAEDEPLFEQAGWTICMDVDEFINVHVGRGHLSDLFSAVKDANMISLTWRLFGNSDVHAYEDRFITEQFELCAPQLVRKPHQAWGFKTLFKNIGLYKKLGVHRPKGLKPDLNDHIKWVNGSGKDMPVQMFRNGWRSTMSTYGYDLVSLNHYAVRSAESFLVKRDRGRVNHVDRDQGLSYWFRMNFNEEHETSIQRLAPETQKAFDRMMSDPDIDGAHAHCVTAHCAKIVELQETEKFSSFYVELTGDRLQSLSRKLKHFGSNVFLEGPNVVPQEIAEMDLPPEFFFTVERSS
jgi:hypothetical protein